MKNIVFIVLLAASASAITWTDTMNLPCNRYITDADGPNVDVGRYEKVCIGDGTTLMHNITITGEKVSMFYIGSEVTVKTITLRKLYIVFDSHLPEADEFIWNSIRFADDPSLYGEFITSLFMPDIRLSNSTNPDQHIMPYASYNIQ